MALLRRVGFVALLVGAVVSGGGRSAFAAPDDGPRPAPIPLPAAPPPPEWGLPPPGAAAPPTGVPSEPASEAPSGGGGDAEPAPPSSGGDAEPAPISPAEGAPARAGADSDSLARGGRHRIAIAPRFAYRLGAAGRSIPPAAGYGVVGTFDFTYARPNDILELTLGVDFSSDRFATTEQGATTQAGGEPATYASTRVISENSFILAQTFACRVGAVRPFVTLGVGAGFGYFDSVAVAYRPGHERDTQLLGRASVGLDILVSEIWGLTVRGDYTAARYTAPFVTETGQSLPLFGDVLDINVGALYRF
jgi:hypothetical protein